MVVIIELGGFERAQRARHRAQKAWNELLGACGSDGAKFGHRLRRLMDALVSTGSFDAALQAEAIRLRVKDLNKKGKSAMGAWE